MRKIDHFALISHSEVESDRFYTDLLGFKRKYDFKVNSKLLNKIFGINKEIKVIRYGGNNCDLEIFIIKDLKVIENSLSHIGIIVENKEKILNRAEVMGYRVNKIPKKDSDSYYLFIKDDSGNYFEIKE
ncbi:MAG: hypothetical protein GF329_06975 [Candidatus Lokiarchaeota archaeon]|nr:hypothetical protein [Candidatus Lokiarchaeota archaeon]